MHRSSGVVREKAEDFLMRTTLLMLVILHLLVFLSTREKYQVGWQQCKAFRQVIGEMDEKSS